MTRDEAQQQASTLNAEHPDRGVYRWMAREGVDGWQVARITVPGGVRVDPLHEAVESRPAAGRARHPHELRPERRRALGRGLGPYTPGGRQSSRSWIASLALLCESVSQLRRLTFGPLRG